MECLEPIANKCKDGVGGIPAVGAVRVTDSAP
jgi:hypothetical protein